MSIPIIDDDVAESTERFISTLLHQISTNVSATISPSEAMIVIIDNDDRK